MYGPFLITINEYDMKIILAALAIWCNVLQGAPGADWLRGTQLRGEFYGLLAKRAEETERREHDQSGNDS